MNTADATFLLRDDEVELTAIRARRAGGKNVNKMSNAVQLRFDIRASSLPDETKVPLLQFQAQRVSGGGVVVIKAQQHRRPRPAFSYGVPRLTPVEPVSAGTEGSLSCDNSLRSRIRSPSLSSAWARCIGVVRA